MGGEPIGLSTRRGSRRILASRDTIGIPVQKRRMRLYLLLAVGDAILLAASYLLVAGVHLSDWRTSFGNEPALSITSLFVVIAFYNRLYSLGCLTSKAAMILTVVRSIGSAIVLFLIVGFFAKASTEISRIIVGAGTLIGAFAIVGYHWVMIELFRRRFGRNFKNIMIVDAGGERVHLRGAYRLNAESLDLDLLKRSPNELHDLGEKLRNMERVIVSCPTEHRKSWAYVLRAIGVRGEMTSDVIQEIGALEIRRERDFSTLLLTSGPLGIRDRVVKRLFDLGASIPLQIFCSPLFAIIALAIFTEDGRPVFFRQRRMGRNNVYFSMLKFRTMRVESEDADGDRSAARDDDRVTRVGAFLRRTSLDELPQLLNVFAGDMSLVGPRPHAIGSRAGEKLFWEVDEAYWLRHAAKPGMTGLAQVRGFRGATECENDLTDRLKSDLEYMTGWSLIRDVAILFRTVRVLVHQKAF